MKVRLVFSNVDGAESKTFTGEDADEVFSGAQAHLAAIAKGAGAAAYVPEPLATAAPATPAKKGKK